jgi:hypothetical protein
LIQSGLRSWWRLGSIFICGPWQALIARKVIAFDWWGNEKCGVILP